MPLTSENACRAGFDTARARCVDSCVAMTPSDPSPAARRSALGGSVPHRRLPWKEVDHYAVMSAELVVAILLYGGLGLLADRWLGSEPWFASVGVLVGLGAGLYLIWLRSERIGRGQDPDESTAQR